MPSVSNLFHDMQNTLAITQTAYEENKIDYTIQNLLLLARMLNETMVQVIRTPCESAESSKKEYPTLGP